MSENNLTEQSSASRIDVTLSIDIESASRGKEFEGEKRDLRSVDTNTPRTKYDQREHGAY